MATMKIPTFSPSPTNPAYRAWALRYRRKYGKNPSRSNITTWKNQWIKAGGATPPASLGLQPVGNIPDWMGSVYEKYRNLWWKNPEQKEMNDWTQQYWQGRAKRPWTNTIRGQSVTGARRPINPIIDAERLSWGRQYGSSLFY